MENGALLLRPACKVSKIVLTSPCCCITFLALYQAGNQKGTFQSYKHMSWRDGMNPYANESWFPSLYKVKMFLREQQIIQNVGVRGYYLQVAASLSVLSVCLPFFSDCLSIVESKAEWCKIENEKCKPVVIEEEEGKWKRKSWRVGKR